MPHINFATRQVSFKLVYYGPGISGKTTNLQVIHGRAPKSKTGELVSIATEGDRTLFFDYMPLDLGQVGGLQTKFQLYTVPGQPYYNATRKLVLSGADGVVFVADSQPGRMEANLESFENLLENLREHRIDPEQLPIVMQWNKRDMADVVSVEELDRALNRFDAPTVEAVAVNGEGVFETLKKLAKMALEKLGRDTTFARVPTATTPTDAPRARRRRRKVDTLVHERITPPEPVATLPGALLGGRPRRARETPTPAQRDTPQRELNVVGLSDPSNRAPRRAGRRQAMALVLLVLVLGALSFAVGGWFEGLPSVLQSAYDQNLATRLGPSPR